MSGDVEFTSSPVPLCEREVDRSSGERHIALDNDLVALELGVRGRA